MCLSQENHMTPKSLIGIFVYYNRKTFFLITYDIDEMLYFVHIVHEAE